jgi:hypothetical protein
LRFLIGGDAASRIVTECGLLFPHRPCTLETSRCSKQASPKGVIMALREEKNGPDSAEFSPVGTWALLCLVLAAMVAAWLFLYFGVFLPRGAVH